MRSLIILATLASLFAAQTAAKAGALPTPATRAARAHLRPGLACTQRLQPASLRLCSVRTDNYKACYNGEPVRPDTRTWLSFASVRASGALYGRDSGQADGVNVPLARVRVHRTGGDTHMPRRAVLVVRVVSSANNVSAVTFRNDPGGLWGVLLQLRHQVRSGAPVVLRLRLLDHRGHTRAQDTVRYVYDTALANAPEGNVEYDGPGGRWQVGSHRTSTDWELGSPDAC
jgi:hypothetical protein